MKIRVVCSARYGQWLSKEEADALTATPAAIADEVHEWATSTGATCKRLPEAFKCQGTVRSIEALLKTELSEYGHKKTGDKIIRRSGKDFTTMYCTHIPAGSEHHH
jgi:hypothetical protein